MTRLAATAWTLATLAIAAFGIAADLTGIFL